MRGEGNCGYGKSGPDHDQHAKHDLSMPESDDFSEELRGDGDQMGQSAISGGTGRVTSWLDHVTNGLTLMGIAALVGVTWRLSDTVTRIDTFISTKAQQYDRDFARIDAALTRHDERLTGLEREQRNSLAHDDNRQKR